MRIRELADDEKTPWSGEEDLPCPSRLLPAWAEKKRSLPRAWLWRRCLLHVHIPAAPTRGLVSSVHGGYEIAVRHSEKGHLDRLDLLEVLR